ncbi:hypothetical protein Cgig2_002437 [Carnegiea gigantea]|uniref:UBX domain-containing protein n=1 Tax=Carnegiea gigantea TaxID=171969 RepID=A0A9Q1KUH0_9CARY|nr:hypothetical protein Cgig2_002437 [Carnegiea gigantea]
MATANRESIETFMSITGVPEVIALRMLEACGGNLNEAIDAHFSEGERNRYDCNTRFTSSVQEALVTVTAPPSDFMDVDDHPEMEHHGPSSLLSATRGLNPFSLLDPTFRRNLLDSTSHFDSSSDLMGHAPSMSEPREMRGIPIEVKDSHDNLAGHSGRAPRVEDVTDTLHAEGPDTQGPAIIDDDRIVGDLRGNRISAGNNGPSAPQFDNTTVFENDIEEEMIRAAIEASKRDADLQNKQDLHDVGPAQMPSQHDDADLEHAVSLSLKTAEQERLQRELGLKFLASGSSAHKPAEMEKLGKIDEPTRRRQEVRASDKPSLRRRKKDAGSSSIQDDIEESDGQPLARHRHRSSASEEACWEVGEAEVRPVRSPSRSTIASQTQPIGNALPADEWGGISSEEHEEAVMLEAAMFGGIPQSRYPIPYAPHQFMQSGLDTWRTPRPPSPSLVAQRTIREEQDDEYLAALQADREKVLRAVEEEKAAKETALKERREKEEESRRKLEEEQELERQLAAKQASLSEEPSLDDENAVTLLVRMPDGSRRGRRFCKTDRLEFLFDFIDVGRGVKPGTYRVRPYPRRAFSAEENSLTLNELGLINKQEALFLELIQKKKDTSNAPESFFVNGFGRSGIFCLQFRNAHGGDLNEAINAHFGEGDRNVGQGAPVTAAAPTSDFMDIDDPPELEHRGPSSILSATGLNPFSLLDPTIRRNLFDRSSLFDSSLFDSAGATGRAPFVSQPREVREIPIEVKDSSDDTAGHSGHGPRIEDVTDTLQEEGPVTHGTVIIDDEDEDGITGDLQGNQSSDTSNRPSAQFDDTTVYENDIEEEMIRAAIEASKRDAELQNKQDLDDVEPLQMPSQRDDADLEHAVSLSLKTAEQERLQREQGLKAGASGSSAEKPVEMEEFRKIDEATARQGVGASDKPSLDPQKIEVGNSSIQDEVEESEEQPLVRHRSRRRSSASEEQMEVGEAEVSPVLSPLQSTVASQTQLNGNAFPDEWGGISSEEHDEAVMLEAAMFGGIPENGYRAPYAPHQLMRSRLDTAWGSPRPPSPSLVAQRAIREQQDDEYLAALQADREKELRAMEEEKAAKEAALMEQRRKEEESQRKLQEEQELERQLAAKQASLPEEPPVDDENAVNLLVRMPDGSRRGRRFRKTDKLQSLFDFIDIGRGVKPCSYRVNPYEQVRPYPRRAFSTEESNLTLNELGLTSKQEALFLELI